MSCVLLAIIMVLFFEGAMIGIAPNAWKQAMREITSLPSSKLRTIGLSMSLTAMLLLIWRLWWGI